MFTLSRSRVTNDAKQAIVNGCKGFEKKDTKGFFLLMACYCLKLQSVSRDCAFSAEGNIKTSLYVTKKCATAMLKMIGFIVKARFNRHNGATFLQIKAETVR